MGNHKSCDSNRSTVTAKLILLNGQLLEFLWPIKVSNLLKEDSDCFICSSDEMEFGEFAAEMGGDEALRPGELYFELPVGWRSHRLQAADMAVLAAKASLAIANGESKGDGRIIGCCCYGFSKVEPAPAVLPFCEKEPPLLGAEDGGVRVRKDGGGGCRRRRYVANLSAIVEE